MSDETPSQDPGTIACMMLPIQARTLLVPYSNIAEMAAVAPIFPDNSGPNWFLGYYNWRNQRVPLISFERLVTGQGGGINPNGRIAVFNNTGVHKDIQFIAIPTQGIPRQINVRPSEIVQSHPVASTHFERMYVKIGSEDMTIPDISALERAYCGYRKLY
jgi:chemosensory pili system protein ChpC